MPRSDVVKTTKDEFVKFIMVKDGASKKKAEERLNVFTGFIADAIKAGKNVAIPKVGILKIAQRKERKCRNPKNGEIVNVPARKVVTFKVDKGLKDSLV